MASQIKDLEDEAKRYTMHNPFPNDRDGVDRTKTYTMHNPFPTITRGDTSGHLKCLSCKELVKPNIEYKAGAFAWIMCIVFICCGLIIGCCLIPFFVKYFKDVHYVCPRCSKTIEVEKKKCCK